MAEERWFRQIEVNGVEYRAEFVRRPFREGLEVRVELPDETITIAELGLGELALLERARSLINEKIKKRQ